MDDIIIAGLVIGTALLFFAIGLTIGMEGNYRCDKCRR